MPSTVNTAFDYFMTNYVNLDKSETALARGSRLWLVDQIHSFDGKIADFPVLYSEMDMFFGSFDRKTKKRELDDIDIIITLSAQGSIYGEYNGRIELTVSEYATHLKKYCHDDSNKINSRKIINKFIKSLSEVPQYVKADIHTRREAAILNLKSYPWSFDIVPGFFTQPELSGRTFYLIPDGQGHWKKTDPRIDSSRCTQINQKHNGNILNVIRIMKYWNKRPTMPSIGSYLLENMILDYYNQRQDAAIPYVDSEFTLALKYISTAIYRPVIDPSGIQDNLNNLSFDDMNKISDRALTDYMKAVEARLFEQENNHEASIKKWKEVFGTDFPSYN